jgi:hypothetical protein
LYCTALSCTDERRTAITDLVDETGRCLSGDKRGFISLKTAKVINKIGIDPNCWLDELKEFKSIGFYSYHP